MEKYKIASISEMANKTANRSEISDSVILEVCIWALWSTFDLLVFIVILGSFGALSQNVL